MPPKLMINGDYIVEIYNSPGGALIRFYPVVNYYEPITCKVSDCKEIYSDYAAELLSGNISAAEVFLNVSKDIKGDLILKWSNY